MNAPRATIRATGAALIGLACAAPHAPAADADVDGLDDAFEEALINRFAPVVKLHPTDEYQPARVSWYLPRVEMRIAGKDCVCADESREVLPKGAVNLASLTRQSALQPTRNWIGICSWDTLVYSGLAVADPDLVTGFLLKTPDDADRPATRHGDWSTAECYVQVRGASRHPGTYDVQYWFFYPYNGPIDAAGTKDHEGDWEHVTVRVELDGITIHAIYFAAHNNEGRWYHQDTGGPNGYTLRNGRPIVYSARYSHASYPWAGTWDRGSNPDDYASDDGIEWDCLGKTVNAGETGAPMPGQTWLRYSGRWGKCGGENANDGPYGPAFQDSWLNDPVTGDDLADHAWNFVAQSSPAPGDGSWVHPFHEFTAGAAAVPAGGTVWIFPGDYAAAGRYTKPMALRAVSGGVTLD